MVDDPRRKRIEVDIGKLIRAYDHGAVLLPERIHELLHGIRPGIDIVRVELECETSAGRMMDGSVPVAPYGVIAGALRDVYQTRVVK